jgi:CheY-like chemotaxis protein
MRWPWPAMGLNARGRGDDGDRVDPLSHALASSPRELRLLIVDDEQPLHEDYQKCLAAPARRTDRYQLAKDELFGPATRAPAAMPTSFRLSHAYAGAAALKLVEGAVLAGDRFSVAFVDMRMPPGWDGVETIRRVWGVDPAVQVVLCTAFSDFTWDAVLKGVGRSDGLHLLRKPFDAAHVRRFAEVLSKKWDLARPANERPMAPGDR